MRRLPPVEGPRLLRSVGAHLLALAGAALLTVRSPAKQQERPAPERVKPERRIRVVQIPRQEQKPAPVPAPLPQPAPLPAQKPPPPVARAQAQQQEQPQPPPRAQEKPARAQLPAKPLRRIAADSTAVQGVPFRVLVPRSPAELASHLRNSGGCMVVSRLSGQDAEVLSVLGLDGRELAGPPCSGVPRLLRDAALNQALGDPLGRARAQSPGGELVLQVLLSPELHATAQAALRARFGPVSPEDMARKAAESGYQLTCFAEPAGPLRCE